MSAAGSGKSRVWGRGAGNLLCYTTGRNCAGQELGTSSRLWIFTLHCALGYFPARSWPGAAYVQVCLEGW